MLMLLQYEQEITPAQRPWLAEGISRSTYYRRKAKGRQQAALAHDAAAREAMLDRLHWQVVELRASLDRAAAFNAAIGQVLNAPLPLVW
jgi:hypothetical protein